MKKNPERSIILPITLTLQQLQEKWASLYAYIRMESLDKELALTITCIDHALRIDELFKEVFTRQSTSTITSEDCAHSYATLHEHLKVIETELGKLNLTSSGQILKDLQKIIPKDSESTTFTNILAKLNFEKPQPQPQLHH